MEQKDDHKVPEGPPSQSSEKSYQFSPPWYSHQILHNNSKRISASSIKKGEFIYFLGEGGGGGGNQMEETNKNKPH